MQSSFKEHFQPIVFQSCQIENWRSLIRESIHVTSTSAKDLFTSRLDKRIGFKSWSTTARRSCSTATRRSFSDSHEEKFLDKQNSSNQPNQSQNQSVIDQGNLITNTKCLLIKEKHPGLKRSRRNLFTKNSVLQIDQGNLISRQAWLELRQICLEKSELSKPTIDQGNLINMKSHFEQPPEVPREITTLNTDNELTRERIEDFMDFKIPGLPHSICEQLQSASVRELIQKMENHPNRHAFQRDLQQSQSFNPFSQESKQVIHEVGNIELCELLDMEPKNAVQSMFIILGHRHRLLHVRALLAKRNRGK